MSLPDPFAYPKQPHVRRHGPQGYSKHREYRNWLRDEFSFRCVYCLCRETWGKMPRDFEVDHILPKSKHRALRLDYDNLCYACANCNGTKAEQIVPRPESIAYGACLLVDVSGAIHARNDSAIGREIIEALDLDAPDYRAIRRRIITTISENKPGSGTMKWCLGYPDELPDLSKERELKPNKRRNGIYQSHYERKRRDELSDYY